MILQKTMECKTPAVTVLMPVRNGEKYIREAIDSVLCQSYANFELLIVNDGSIDSTDEIIRSFSDQRIRHITRLPQGISAALNDGLRQAAGAYIARFDADDICLPHRLEKQVAFLDSHPDYVLVGSDAEYIEENGNHLFDFKCAGHSNEEMRKNIAVVCPFIHSAVMYRKDPIMLSGGYTDHAHSFEDHLLWVNVVKLGKCCNLSEQLVKIRFNPSSVTIDEKWRGRIFKRIKRTVLERGSITADEGERLVKILRKQETVQIKGSSYHALCSKKFLANNYNPRRARWHASRAILIHPLHPVNYALYAASYLPQRIIRWLKKEGS